MSFESSGDDAIGGDERRAAHVKWDGKTIALGTFSAQVAAEKCNRAKALTKEWRTTMVPKPDVEWVKEKLEQLSLRVVNDRPGRRKKRTINEVETKSNSPSSSSSSPSHQKTLMNLAQSRDQAVCNSHNSMDLNNQTVGRDSFATMGAENAGNSMDRVFPNPSYYRGNSQRMGLPNSVLASLPTNVYNNVSNTRSVYENYEYNNDPQTNTLHIDEAARMRSLTTQQRLANLVFGSYQHYRVLKEHHTNLLKELQETTTLMNIYHRNNSQQNIDSLTAARIRNLDGFDPFFDQSLFAGSNQLYPQSTGRRNSFGLGGNFQGMRMSQLNQYQAGRRDSLRSIFPMQTPNYIANEGDVNGNAKK